MTQRELGEMLGITVQQLQKYESGANRISAARLSEIATALQRSIPELFGIEEDIRTGRQEAKSIIATLRTMRRAELGHVDKCRSQSLMQATSMKPRKLSAVLS